MGCFAQKVPVPFSPIARTKRRGRKNCPADRSRRRPAHCRAVVSRFSATCFLVASSAERLLRVVSSLSGSWRPIHIVGDGCANVNAACSWGSAATGLGFRRPEESRKSNSPGDPSTGRRRTVSPLGIRIAGMKAASESHHRSFAAAHFEKVCRLGGRGRGNRSRRLERMLGIERSISRNNSREPTAPGGRPQFCAHSGSSWLPTVIL